MNPATVSWWRQNRVALPALLGLVSVTAAVIVGNGVRASRAGNPSVAISVGPGESTVYGPATVGPASVTLSTDSKAPASTHVITVTITVDNGAGFACTTPTLRETTGMRRRWNDRTTSLADTDLSLPVACDPSQTGPYQLAAHYLVPDDTTGPLVVELWADDQLPQYVEFIVRK